MPTVLRLDGLRVVIYPADHRPAHVHVIGAKGEAVFVLNCPDGPPSLRESYGFSRREELRIQKDLAGPDPADLAEIEITPSGLGLHWPRLDADVYVPGFMKGIYGTRRWMAALLGAEGGKSSSPAKAAAARTNGAKGGRPRKQA